MAKNIKTHMKMVNTKKQTKQNSRTCNWSPRRVEERV